MESISKRTTKTVWKGCLCAIGCEVFFGLSTVFTKYVTNDVSGLTLLGWRFFIAFIVMHTLKHLGVIRAQIRASQLKKLLRIALFSPVLYFFLETLGIRYTTASESGAFFSSIPVISLIASTLILRKKPTKHQVVGIGITVVGVLITVAAAGFEASFSPAGYAALTMAIISYSLYSVYVEESGMRTEDITYMMLACAAAVFVPLALGEHWIHGTLLRLIQLPVVHAGFLFAVLYQGIACSILAFFLSNIAIEAIGVNRTASFIGISTVVSVAAGILFLGETFGIFQLIGVTVILIGVYTANLRSQVSVHSPENAGSQKNPKPS